MGHRRAGECPIVVLTDLTRVRDEFRASRAAADREPQCG
jgi:hypothetical protein